VKSSFHSPTAQTHSISSTTTAKYAPAGFVYNGTNIYFYTKNLQGDITGIVFDKYSNLTLKRINALFNRLKKTGKVMTAVSNSLNKARNDVMTHATNVINIAYCKDKGSNYNYQHCISFKMSKDEYRNHWISVYNSLWDIMLGGYNQDITGKSWNRLSNDVKVNILNTIGTWDSNIAVAIGQYYGIKTGVDLLFNSKLISISSL